MCLLASSESILYIVIMIPLNIIKALTLEGQYLFSFNPKMTNGQSTYPNPGLSLIENDKDKVSMYLPIV